MVVDCSTTAVVSIVSADLARESIYVDNETCLWLQTASGCVNLQPTVVKLQKNREELHGPELLRHTAPKHRVQLLGLPPAALEQQQPSRSLVYTTAILQHAALLLLLLVSDSLLLVVPAAAVPASLLQLLHVLSRVKQLLLQQLLAIRRHEMLPRRAHQQQQDTDEHQAAVSEGAAQQCDRLLQLLQQKQPTQLHISLQAAPTDAAAAVAQAEQTLLKCKAITAAASLQQGSRKTPASGSSSSSRAGSPLFELAGIHCCGSSFSTAQANRKLVMNAIKNHLAKTDQLAAQQQRIPKEQQGIVATSQNKEQQHQRQQQQQQQQTVAPPQLQSVSQVLASVAAAAAAAAAGQSTAAAEQAMHSITGPMLEIDLQQLWQQLLQLLFPGAAKGPKPYPLHTHTAMQLSDIIDDAIAAGDDVTDASEDDGSWDESDGGWQEVGHGNESHSPGEGAETAGEILAAAVDPLFLLSAKRCMAAAKAAVAHYLKIVPQRYSQATHEVATAQALSLYTATASGPAQQEMQQQLVDCCLAAWQAGRQQCSATSLTGRQCTLGPHDSTVEHDSGTLLLIATPDGSSVAQQRDWFSLDQANIAPAKAVKQQQQQVPGSKLLQLVNITAQLLVYQQQQEPASTSSNHASNNVSQLGPWLSAWVLGFGGAAYNPGDGLPGPGWLPGFNKLLPLRVLAVEVSSSAGASSAPELIQGAGRGTGGRGRAAAAAAGSRGPWGAGRGQKGGRGQHGKAAAAAALTLGPEDFPTLAEAVIGRKQPVGPGPAATAAGAASSAADRQQQRGKEDQGETAALPAQQDSEASRKAGGRGAQQQQQQDVAAAQQQLIQAWAQLGQPQQQGSGMAAASSRSSLGTGNAASANAAAAATGGGGGRRGRSEGSARGRGGSRGRGRGGRQDQNRGAAAAAAVVGSSDDRAHETAALLATVWIGLEYESLSGVRAVLQPVQLLKSLQQEQQQRTAAAAAASSAVRNLPAADRHQQKKGGGRSAAPPARQQQDQALHQHGSNNVDQVSGVEQLLLQDIPLFMPAAAVATAQAGSATEVQAAAGTQLGPECSTGQQVLSPVDLELLQLQRIYICTPASSFALASKPCVQFSSTAAAAASQPSNSSSSRPTMGLSTVHVSSVDAESTNQSSTMAIRHQQVPSATATSAPTSSSAATVSTIEFSTENELTLPPNSLIVLHLPKIYAAPSSWAHQVDPAAAAAMPTAALQSSDSSNSSSGNSADGSMHVRHEAGAADATTAAAANLAGPGMSADVSCAGSQATSEHSSTAVHAAAVVPAVAGEVGVAKRTTMSEILSPLVPGKLTSATGTVTGSSSSGDEALCCWSACLKAGSWLYPAAVKPAAE